MLGNPPDIQLHGLDEYPKNWVPELDRVLFLDLRVQNPLKWPAFSLENGGRDNSISGLAQGEYLTRGLRFDIP
jgi:hypothetical protein